MERSWRIDRRNWKPWIVPRFNIAPTSVVPIIRMGSDQAIELLGARWGLIPNWWKKEAPPSLSFNARSEEAAEKPLWRNSVRSMRCLMPARGWYEWNENEPVKTESGRAVNQPYFIHSPGDEVIAFAALWSVWQGPGQEPVMSCALMTKAAAPSIAGIHHRMPVVLPPELQAAWMNATTSAAEIGDLIAAARGDFEGYAVSTRVNSPRNDSPELLAPIAT